MHSFRLRAFSRDPHLIPAITGFLLPVCSVAEDLPGDERSGGILPEADPRGWHTWESLRAGQYELVLLHAREEPAACQIELHRGMVWIPRQRKLTIEVGSPRFGSRARSARRPPRSTVPFRATRSRF